MLDFYGCLISSHYCLFIKNLGFILIMFYFFFFFLEFLCSYFPIMAIHFPVSLLFLTRCISQCSRRKPMTCSY